MTCRSSSRRRGLPLEDPTGKIARRVAARAVLMAEAAIMDVEQAAAAGRVGPGVARGMDLDPPTGKG